MDARDWTRASLALSLVLSGLLGTFITQRAYAVPSFGRQTGLACEACHTAFPELTPFGRRFKLNGYVLDNLPQERHTSVLLPQLHLDVELLIDDVSAGVLRVDAREWCPALALEESSNTLFPLLPGGMTSHDSPADTGALPPAPRAL